MAIFRVQLLIYPQTFFASNLGCFPNPAREKSVSSHVKKVFDLWVDHLPWGKAGPMADLPTSKVEMVTEMTLWRNATSKHV